MIRFIPLMISKSTVWMVLMALVTFCSGCVKEPRTLVYEKHSCDFCKMTLIDNRFGGLVETEKGRAYRFDDISCMLKFEQEHLENTQQVVLRQVIDYRKPGQLIPAEEAFYLKSDKIKTPMDSQVAAFGTKEEFESSRKELRGIQLVWGEIITQFR